MKRNCVSFFVLIIVFILPTCGMYTQQIHPKRIRAGGHLKKSTDYNFARGNLYQPHPDFFRVLQVWLLLSSTVSVVLCPCFFFKADRVMFHPIVLAYRKNDAGTKYWAWIRMMNKNSWNFTIVYSVEVDIHSLYVLLIVAEAVICWCCT